MATNSSSSSNVMVAVALIFLLHCSKFSQKEKQNIKLEEFSSDFREQMDVGAARLGRGSLHLSRTSAICKFASKTNAQFSSECDYPNRNFCSTESSSPLVLLLGRAALIRSSSLPPWSVMIFGKLSASYLIRTMKATAQPCVYLANVISRLNCNYRPCGDVCETSVAAGESISDRSAFSSANVTIRGVQQKHCVITR